MNSSPTTIHEEDWTQEQRDEYHAHISIVLALHRAQATLLTARRLHTELMASLGPIGDEEFALKAAIHSADGRASELAMPMHLQTVGLALVQVVIESWAGKITKKGDILSPKWPFKDSQVDALIVDREKRKAFADYRNVVFHIDELSEMAQLELLSEKQGEYLAWAFQLIDAMTAYFTDFFERWRLSGAVPTE